MTEKGYVSLGNYDLLGLGTSALISNKMPVMEQLQGVQGSFVSYTLNDGLTYPIAERSSGTTAMSIGLGVVTTNGVPIVSDFFGGLAQGVLNR